jgi:hypothetical protein
VFGNEHRGRTRAWLHGQLKTTKGQAVKTIPRNHKRKVADIKKRATRCVVKSLRNDFAAVECAPSVAWSDLAEYDFARLVEYDGKWHVNVHSNLWYELREA